MDAYGGGFAAHSLPGTPVQYSPYMPYTTYHCMCGQSYCQVQTYYSQPHNLCQMPTQIYGAPPDYDGYINSYHGKQPISSYGIYVNPTNRARSVTPVSHIPHPPYASYVYNKYGGHMRTPNDVHTCGNTTSHGMAIPHMTGHTQSYVVNSQTIQGLTHEMKLADEICESNMSSAIDRDQFKILQMIQDLKDTCSQCLDCLTWRNKNDDKLSKPEKVATYKGALNHPETSLEKCLDGSFEESTVIGDDDDHGNEELMLQETFNGARETMLNEHFITMLNASFFIPMPIFEFLESCMAVDCVSTLLGDIISVKYALHPDGIEQVICAHKLPSLLKTRLHALEDAEETAIVEIPSSMAASDIATAAIVSSAGCTAVETSEVGGDELLQCPIVLNIAVPPCLKYSSNLLFCRGFSPHYAGYSSLKILLQYYLAELQLGGLILVTNNLEVYASYIAAVSGWLIVINTYKDNEERTLQAHIGEILVNYLICVFKAAVANDSAFEVTEIAITAKILLSLAPSCYIWLALLKILLNLRAMDATRKLVSKIAISTEAEATKIFCAFALINVAAIGDVLVGEVAISTKVAIRVVANATAIAEFLFVEATIFSNVAAETVEWVATKIPPQVHWELIADGNQYVSEWEFLFDFDLIFCHGFSPHNIYIPSKNSERDPKQNHCGDSNIYGEVSRLYGESDETWEWLIAWNGVHRASITMAMFTKVVEMNSFLNLEGKVPERECIVMYRNGRMECS